MTKFKITREFFDGRDVDSSDIGIIRGKDLEAFISHLLDCGYEGGMEEKHGRFSVTIDPGWLDHHGNHHETIYIDEFKEPKRLSPANWGKEVIPMEALGYKKGENGVYYWEESEEEYDDDYDDETYESDYDDEDD